MASRISTENVANVQVRVKRMPTRSQVPVASRNALGDIGNSKLNKPGHVVPLDKKSTLGAKRPTKIAGRRMAKPKEETATPMEVKEKTVDSASAEPSVPCLPEGVADIDLLDADNPQLCAEYVPIMYNYLRHLEQETAVKQDFLKGCPINGKMRGVLLDWLIEVHLQFKLLQETLYMTVAIIDRFLQVEGLTIRRNKLQLVGVTAMFIASKVEEMYAPEINDFVYITDNAYSSTEIRQMELRILRTINFGLGRPLPLHFLRRNSKAGDVDVLQHTVAKYLLEASITEYEMAHCSPSIMAAAALFLALRLLEPDVTLATCWNASLQHYSSYTTQQLVPVVCKMAAIVVRSKDSKLTTVYTKYTSKKFLKVSEMEELKGDLIQKLASKNTDGL